MNRNNILIEADELLTKLNDENLRLYDATLLFFGGAGPTAYEQYLQAHIPGAAFFDHQKVSDSNSNYSLTILPGSELAAPIGDLGIAEDSQVVVYACGVLPAATRAWWVLRFAGHNNVRILNGGFAAWNKAGGKIESGVQQYQPVTFKAQPRANMFASKEEVLEAIKDETVSTVNTLLVDSYEAEHIVSSVCLPCLDLMQAMDAFLPYDKLAERLKELARYKRIITYCGGGIAATVNAVAHLIVEHENVAVYDGSLYEWTAEELPTEGKAIGGWEIWRRK
ncbi:MAG: sulfurtransferase [Chloroflexi bacterium]|nr:sulfurtransferase [Chloroflexota bacterium]